ncbi:MAG: hypothetical protein OXC80_11780 [Gammaproteobacteria bacterium]|nr:hypothetical protein [Gammaproteobacteria bacterium]
MQTHITEYTRNLIDIHNSRAEEELVNLELFFQAHASNLDEEEMRLLQDIRGSYSVIQSLCRYFEETYQLPAEKRHDEEIFGKEFVAEREAEQTK